jgi:hypothetical protein
VLGEDLGRLHGIYRNAEYGYRLAEWRGSWSGRWVCAER